MTSHAHYSGARDAARDTLGQRLLRLGRHEGVEELAHLSCMRLHQGVVLPRQQVLHAGAPHSSLVDYVGEHEEYHGEEWKIQVERPSAASLGIATVVLLGLVAVVGGHGLDQRRRVRGGSGGVGTVLAGLLDVLFFTPAASSAGRQSRGTFPIWTVRSVFNASPVGAERRKERRYILRLGFKKPFRDAYRSVLGFLSLLTSFVTTRSEYACAYILSLSDFWLSRHGGQAVSGTWSPWTG
jgi:hypothetical protein